MTDKELINLYCQKAIRKLRTALDEESKAEPVASLMTNTQSGDVELAWNDDGFSKALWYETELYTAPPQRKPLTDEEIASLISTSPPSFAVEIVRIIERAHGIGGEE